MPTGTPLSKVTATQGCGATVVLHGATYDDAYAHARELQRREGAVFIPAFDDPDVIAGQGTPGLEILADLPDVEAILVGIGGGGLISGLATAIEALRPEVRVIGVVTVDDDESVRAVLLLLERCKLPVEGAGAVGVAAPAAGPLSKSGLPVRRPLGVGRGERI